MIGDPALGIELEIHIGGIEIQRAAGERAGARGSGRRSYRATRLGLTDANFSFSGRIALDHHPLNLVVGQPGMETHHRFIEPAALEPCPCGRSSDRKRYTAGLRPV